MQNTIKQRFWAGLLASAALFGLAACGGGGDSGDSRSPLVIANTDTFGSTPLAGDTTGIWDPGGGAGDSSGGADAGGAAGVGEFVEMSIRFPANSVTFGTINWKILRSEYGLTGATGTLSIQQDLSRTTAENGGYRVVGYPGEAANLFVERSGQITGALGVTLGGTTTYVPFTAIRYADTLQTLTAVAGVYKFAYLLSDSSTSSNPETGYGAMQINANGSGGICWSQHGVSFGGYSSTCSGHITIAVQYDNPATPRILRITSSDSHNILAYATARTWGTSNVAMSMDIRLTSGGQSRTGAMYGSRVGGTFTPGDYVGAWNAAGTDLENTPSLSHSARIAIADLGGNIRYASDEDGTCVGGSKGDVSAPAFDSTVGFATEDGFPASTSLLIPLGQDFLVAVIESNMSDAGALTFLRRYSTDPNNAPCAPTP